MKATKKSTAGLAPASPRTIDPETLRIPLQKLFNGIMRAKAFTGVVAAAGRDDAIDENDAIEFYAPEADNATEALMPLLDDVLKRLDLGPLFAGPQDEAETAA